MAFLLLHSILSAVEAFKATYTLPVSTFKPGASQWNIRTLQYYT